MIEKIKKIIMNFSIGIVVLMISYMMVYFIGGEAAYKQDIASMQDVKSLIIQCCGVGIFYILFDNVLKYLIKFVSIDEAKDMNFKKLFKFLGITMIGFPLISLILNFSNLPSNVGKIYCFNIIMLMIILMIISMIIQFVEVKKINKFLKKRKENI